ncbi:MAG: amidohydrolase family protein [Isosphaeraceae bacterium]
MPTLLDRRAFLAGAASTGLAGLAMARRDDPATPPIVDTHVHLWDLSRFRLPWLEGAPNLNHSVLVDDYREASAGLNVVKAVYMEVDVEPSQQEREARWIIDLCRRRETPVVAAVISGRPAAADFAAYIKPLAREPEVKGLRQVLHGPDTPRGYCLDDRFQHGVRLLGELGLSFDLCMRAEELSDGVKLIDACPGTSFIIDHCGNASVFAGDHAAWKRDMAALARRRNAVCKVSGIVASTKGRSWTPDDLAPFINHVLDSFGPDRVVFGGDWPVCTLGAPLAGWVKALRQVVAERPEIHQRKLFHDNAVRVYRLS